MQMDLMLEVELVRIVVAVEAKHVATYARCNGFTVRESTPVTYADLIEHAFVASWRPAAWCTSELYHAVLAIVGWQHKIRCANVVVSLDVPTIRAWSLELGIMRIVAALPAWSPAC